MHRFFDAVIVPMMEVLRPRVVVEIGVLEGELTRRLVDHATTSEAVVHAIDPAPRSVPEETPSFVFYRAPSHDALPDIEGIDLALIDGDHNYHTVLNELRILSQNARRDGHDFPVVMLHDVDWPYGRRDSYYDPSSIPAHRCHPYARAGLRPGHVGTMSASEGLCARRLNADREGGAANGVLTAVEDFVDESSVALDYIHLPVLHGLGILYPRSRTEVLAPVVDALRLSEPLVALLGATEADRLRHQIRSQELGRRHALGEPDLSIIVVVYNMSREAQRTLHSLTRAYQRDTTVFSYEVIVVENGSERPLDPDWVRSLGPEFSYLRLPKIGDSPAPAINTGVASSKARLVGILIDGARILSPGTLIESYEAARTTSSPVVATLGWHLGPEIQGPSRRQPYDQSTEDRLLKRIGWPEDGYRLFDVSVFAGSSREGHFGRLAESNFMVMTRQMFDRLGGLDERFQSPGGGLVNHDFFTRAVSTPDARLIMLLGEGTFHQLHGGATTGGGRAPPITFEQLADEYRELKGHGWRPLDRLPVYYGRLNPKTLAVLADSTNLAVPAWSADEPRFSAIAD